MSRTYMWSLFIALAWPAMQNIIYVARFGRLSFEVLGSSLVFFPMGLVSAMVLLYLIEKAKSRSQKASTVFGYLLASPFALVASVLSGLLIVPVVGTLISGTVPLVIGTVVGYVVGGLMRGPEWV